MFYTSFDLKMKNWGKRGRRMNLATFDRENFKIFYFYNLLQERIVFIFLRESITESFCTPKLEKFDAGLYPYRNTLLYCSARSVFKKVIFGNIFSCKFQTSNWPQSLKLGHKIYFLLPFLVLFRRSVRKSRGQNIEN